MVSSRCLFRSPHVAIARCRERLRYSIHGRQDTNTATCNLLPILTCKSRPIRTNCTIQKQFENEDTWLAGHTPAAARVFEALTVAPRRRRRRDIVEQNSGPRNWTNIYGLDRNESTPKTLATLSRSKDSTFTPPARRSACDAVSVAYLELYTALDIPA